MTEEKLKQVVEKSEKYRGSTEAICLLFCLILSGVIMCFAAAGNWSLLIMLVLPIAIAYSLLPEYYAAVQKRNPVFVWNEFTSRYARLESIARQAQELSSRIRKLYEADDTAQVLPPRMATRLFNVYNNQQNLLEQIHAKLQENSHIHQELQDSVQHLDDLHVEHEAGQNSLRQLEEDHKKLLLVQADIEESMRHLD